jgi:hypothetical protein
MPTIWRLSPAFALLALVVSTLLASTESAGADDAFACP